MKFWGKFREFFTSVKNSKSRRTLVIVLAIVLLIIVGFLTYAASYSKIMPNTWINDASVGGMSKDNAASLIEKHFAEPLKSREITLKCKDREITVLFSDLGVSADVDATIESAFSAGRENGVFSKAIAFVTSGFKKTVLPLATTSNEAFIDKTISTLADGYETEVTNTEYKIDKKLLTIKKGSKGKKVNRSKALAQIVEAAGNPKLSQLTFSIENAEPDSLDIDALYKELTAPAKDAYYEYKDGTVNVVDEKVMVVVGKEEIEKAFSSEEPTYSIKVETILPEITAEKLRALLFRDTLGSYSSSFATSTEARATNVRLSASRINEYVLMPGDVFSYDKTIGRRTAANGFRNAGVYVGNKVEDGIGGGICQTSSTLYSAALYANLEIVSRTSHSLPVSYVPAGQDATIAEGAIDLKLKNNTEYPVKIVAVTSGRTLTCKILGVKVPNQSVEIVNTRTSTIAPKTERTTDETVPVGYKKILNNGANGYTIASVRVVKLNGEIIKTENLTKSVYHAAPIEEVVNPADQNTPTENLIVFTGQVIPTVDVTEPNVEEEPSEPTSGEITPPTEEIAPENTPELEAPVDETPSDGQPNDITIETID